MAHQTVPRQRTTVPFVDLRPSHSALREPLLADFAQLIDTGTFTNGPPVQAFEALFADYCGTRFCVGVASGLDALRLALVVADRDPGDEVIVPAATFVATFEAVTQAGYRPVPVDISAGDYGLDPEAAAAAVTERTRFLLPVHLYGQMAQVAALREVGRRHDLGIIEDACQAHGAERDGVRAGMVGLAGAFSFYPAKNLGAFGDAGALCTDDAELADSIRALREHGQFQKYEHGMEGYTARLDTIQAAVLLRKLPLLDEWNDQRRRAAAFYLDALSELGDLHLPSVAPASDPVWHLFVVRTREPLALQAFLAERGISTARHYPCPPHLSAAYAQLGYARGAFPVAERLSDECLSLPMFPGISDAQLAAVAEAIADFFRVA